MREGQAALQADIPAPFPVGDPLVRKIHRADIQGLRAIGITLVVLFHIWVGKVSGGVDVFFVVSSYLMTVSLLSALERTGKVDFLRFWGRIALRILPTAALVLSATLVLGAFFEPRSSWADFSLNALASVLQLENLQLMQQATDYLARGTPASPFQQFWALSNQMQFYAILPAVILACALISRHALRVRYSVTLHIAVTGLLSAMSFAFALWILSVNPAPHYFNPAARLWEFMVGSVCAMLAGRITLGRSTSLVLGWVGLALILACGIVIPVSAPFPGLAALMPVSGAVLVLITGAQEHSAGSAGALLSRPLLQSAAGISFATYLWHWPILNFAQEIVGTTQLSAIAGLIVIGLAVLASIFTKRFIEDPCRKLQDASFLARRPRWVGSAFPFATSFVLLAPSLAFIVGWNHHFASISRAYIQSSTPPRPLGKIRTWDTTLPPDIDAQLIASKAFLPKLYSNGCSQKPKSTRLIVCTAANPDPKAYTIVLAGGSHSIHWYPALEEIAKHNGFRLITITKAACPIDGVYIGPDVVSTATSACATWAREAINKIIEIKPDLVFTTATRPGPHNVGDIVPATFKPIWKRLSDAGIAVAAIRDNPRAEFFYMPLCIERHKPDPSACNLKRAEHLSVPNPLDLAPPPSPLVKYIDLSDYLCTPEICPAMVRGVMIYNDNSHLSVPFVQSLTSTLERELLAVVKSTSASKIGRPTSDTSPPVGKQPASG